MPGTWSFSQSVSHSSNREDNMSYAFIDMNNLPDGEILAIWIMDACLRDNHLTAGEHAAKMQALKECEGMHMWHVYYHINGELDYTSVIAKSDAEAAFLAGSIQDGRDQITFVHTLDVCCN